MKILYLHQYFTFPDRNGGTRSYDIAKSLIENGYQVEVITSSTCFDEYELPDEWSVIEKEGITVHILNTKYHQSYSVLRRSWSFLQFLIYASLKILNLKGDLVIATSTPLTIGIPALVNKWFRKVPFIFEVRDVWPEAVIAIGAIKNKFMQYLLFRLERLIYNNASVRVPLSRYMESSIGKRLRADEETLICVIENISEVNRFSVPNKKNSKIEKKM